MSVEVSSSRLDDVYSRVLSIEKSERVRNGIIVVLGTGLLVASAVIVMLSLALQSRNTVVDRFQTIGECRDDAFAVWADDLANDEPPEIPSLENAYADCGDR